ncbi:MAG: hypothetical protein JWN78_2739 [Bacteroidota bacterium]|nr:hypothetical protein [Bacteroidota bacterium]
MIKKKKLVVIGGGAAGFFGAISAAESNPDLDIIILEQGNEVLGKVKISGGGRCNVTHACFDVKELIKFYPRGSKELLSPFYHFSCENTVDWFEQRGINLKTEEDGRIFPVTDDSQTIVDCLVNEAQRLGVKIVKQAKVMNIETGSPFKVMCNDEELTADQLLIASGSNPTIWRALKNTHTIITPVPSLFSFHIKNDLLKELEGISFKNVTVRLNNSKIETAGPMLITHRGLSGPAILKLSAFAAIELAAVNYKFSISVNWINIQTDKAKDILLQTKLQQSKKNAGNFVPFEIPARFWKRILGILKIEETKKYADLSGDETSKISALLTNYVLEVNGKSTNKEEFVTAGGISLKEVDFKTMESKIIPGLYFAGEVLNIDGVTGGFNFQSAWTTGYIAGNSIADLDLL